MRNEERGRGARPGACEAVEAKADRTSRPRRRRLFEATVSLAVGLACVLLLLWLDHRSLRAANANRVAELLLAPGIWAALWPLMLVRVNMLRHPRLLWAVAIALDTFLYSSICYALFWLGRFGREEDGGRA